MHSAASSVQEISRDQKTFDPREGTRLDGTTEFQNFNFNFFSRYHFVHVTHLVFYLKHSRLQSDTVSFRLLVLSIQRSCDTAVAALTVSRDVDRSGKRKHVVLAMSISCAHMASISLPCHILFFHGRDRNRNRKHIRASCPPQGVDAATRH